MGISGILEGGAGKESRENPCFPHESCYTKKNGRQVISRLPLIIMAIEDGRAFMTRLYLQYRRLIYSEIRKIIGGRDEAEDLLQTVGAGHRPGGPICPGSSVAGVRRADAVSADREVHPEKERPGDCRGFEHAAEQRADGPGAGQEKGQRGHGTESALKETRTHAILFISQYGRRHPR